MAIETVVVAVVVVVMIWWLRARFGFWFLVFCFWFFARIDPLLSMLRRTSN